METERYEHKNLDVACNLGESDTAIRTEEWNQLKEQAIGTEPIPGGVRLWLPAESDGLVRDLARREALCCGFLDIEVAMQDGQMRLEITSAAPVAAPLIEFLGC
jgi:hypothetical protein